MQSRLPTFLTAFTGPVSDGKGVVVLAFDNSSLRLSFSGDLDVLPVRHAIRPYLLCLPRVRRCNQTCSRSGVVTREH